MKDDTLIHTLPHAIEEEYMNKFRKVNEALTGRMPELHTALRGSRDV